MARMKNVSNRSDADIAKSVSEAEIKQNRHLWACAVGRRVMAKQDITKYEGLLSAANKEFEPAEEYEAPHISHERNTVAYWKAKASAARDQVKILENRAKYLQTLYRQI
jgi:predicted thioesterase